MTKEMNGKLKKVMKEKDEKLKKVMKEKNEELKKVMKEMNEKLEEERCELEELEDMNSVLLIKERQSNDEIQEARKESIRVITIFSCSCLSVLMIYVLWVSLSHISLFFVCVGIERFIR